MPPEHSAFDEAAIARLRLAAEEVAWLTGRGYPLGVASEVVATHHTLGEDERAALAHGTCSEPQYRRRAARELELEDIARRPLAIDIASAAGAIEAACAGRPVLQTIDGSVRAFDRSAYVPGADFERSLDAIFAAAKELRPSLVRLVIPAGVDWTTRLEARAKAAKLKYEVVAAADLKRAFKKEPHVVTGDADVLDTCGGWLNLVGRLVEAVPSARIIRLQ